MNHPQQPTPPVHQPGQDNIQIFGLDIHNPVFAISAVVTVLSVLFAAVFHSTATEFFGWLRPAATNTFDSFLAVAANTFVIFCIALIFTPLGSIRLGGKEARPDFSYPSWFAMLFAAGMGIGLMFFCVSEPISHFSTAFAEDAGTAQSWAPLAGAAGNAEEARRLSMATTIFHWGLHPWAIYAVMGLALAFFAYNRGLPLTIRSVFYPFFGERIWGWPGHIIDVLAVFATLFGLASSLGFGAEQISAGLNHLFGLPVTDTSKALLVVVITAVALYSVIAGINSGVKRLSEINIILAALLLLFVIVIGPTFAIISGFFDSLIAYIRYLPALSNPIGREDKLFFDGWTSFYWAWWISWSPFVGMFIARISRGRTVREFLVSVLLVPSCICILWMSSFGTAALSQVIEQGSMTIVDAALELRLFIMLEGLPIAAITSFIGIVLVAFFFITSSDSGSLVIDIITAGGKINAPMPQRVFWAALVGLIAIVLLLVGGLGALQAAAVTTGIPFAVVLLAMCVATCKGLISERRSLLAAGR
ncbi:BCCT transporter [Ventosimonas gracilis]|uniref:BCCT transporter n=1 Tax=Ventosimonas gracilis TaxID=1680762 RepID=A0A139SWX5_9GAMM|nr:BCCT family transporter [Ventosimonas gracilis]KXU39136.1 BCCT transporter [Ventosimonas gracilis]